MHNYPFILADDTEGIGKIIAFVIVAVIYGIGALAKMIKDANETAKRRAASRPVVTSAPPQQQFAAPLPARRAVPPSIKLAAPPARRVQKNAFAPSAAQRKASAKQMAARSSAAAPQAIQPRAAAVPSPTPPSIPVAATPQRPVTPIAAATATVRPGGASAATIRRWLRPNTMRKQFILTELLQPAMALREPRERH